jgi:hypothetical protein
MAQALKAVGDHMQQKAADAVMRWQGHGLDAIALTPVATCKAHLATLDIDHAVGGDGHAVGGAPERVEHLPRSCQGPLGRDHPRLVIQGVDEAFQALR